MTINQIKPWVEKYRPNILENIVLDNINKVIFDNIVKLNYLPNILLYGPPGTGKTTTIINLIQKFQTNKSLIIHLNASDERGIDIIRNQIYQFVNSKNLFVKGKKIIILDEVDYMTKSAQLALKNLLIDNNNICFCLICNYISKIEESLQNIFIKLKFNQLPENNIINFLNKINLEEKLDYSIEQIKSIQKFYKSDMRSMINYIQLNSNNKNRHEFITDDVYINLTELFKKSDNYNVICNYIDKIILKYNIDNCKLIKIYLNLFFKNNIFEINYDFVKLIEYIIHNPSNKYTKYYFITSLNDYISSLFK